MGRREYAGRWRWMTPLFGDAGAVPCCDASLALWGKQLSELFHTPNSDSDIVAPFCCWAQASLPSFPWSTYYSERWYWSAEREPQPHTPMKISVKETSKCCLYFSVLKGSRLSLHQAGDCLPCSQRPSEDSYSYLTALGWNYSSYFGFFFKYNL